MRSAATIRVQQCYRFYNSLTAFFNLSDRFDLELFRAAGSEIPLIPKRCKPICRVLNNTHLSAITTFRRQR